MGKATIRGYRSTQRLSQGKGLAWTLPPSYGRRCPEGAEVGWGKRYEREGGRSSQVRRYESTAIPISSERIHACVEKQYPKQSLPRVGKVASKASRIGFWRYEKERRKSSQVRRLREHPSAGAPSHLSLAASRYTSHFLRFHSDDTEAGEAQDGEAPA